MGNKELRELKKRRSSLERKMGTARSKIEKARTALLEIDGTDYAALGEQQAKIATLQDELAALEEEWFEVSVELGE